VYIGWLKLKLVHHHVHLLSVAKTPLILEETVFGAKKQKKTVM
jgi:hypothetical protein